MEAGEIILIMGAFSSPLLAAWNAWQGTRIKELEIKMKNLCSECEYDFTPKNKEKSKKLPSAS